MKKRPSAPAVISIPTLVERGQRFLAAGQWREAVENYKQLLKQDPTGGWAPLLAQAYAGRADELAGKAMFKEALILLDNADRLGATPGGNPLRLTCLAATGRIPQAISLYLQTESLLKTAHPDQFPLWQEYVAVLLLTDAGATVAVPADSSWQEPVRVARQALAALCQPGADPSSLADPLRQITVRSPFKTLRLILKALLVVRTEPDKAREWVATIPENSPWSGLAGVITLCTLEMTELLRRSAEFSPPALAIAVSWRGIAPAQWQAARALLAAPPARVMATLVARDLPWAIPEAAVRRTAFLLLVEDLSLRPVFERRFGPLDQLEGKRLLALATGRDPHRGEGAHLRSWQVYLNALKATPEMPDHAQRMAVTHRFLAMLIGLEDREDTRLLAHLEQSLTYDPGDRIVHHSLLAWHKHEEDDQAYGRVLERALQHFPEDAEFLYAAVRVALQNKTFKKAFRLAKRLLTLDPLHAEVRRELIGACLAQARKQVKSGRLDLAGKELAEAAAWERPDERDGVVRINQALLAWLTQQTAEGDAWLEEGKQQAGGGIAACLRAAMEGVRLGLPESWQTCLTEALLRSAKQTATREAILALVQVAHDYVGETRLRQWLADFAPFWLSLNVSAFSLAEQRAICHLLARASVYGVLKYYATRGEKQWRDQPGHYAFVYYRLLAQYQGPRPDVALRDWKRLQELRQQAEKQQDHDLVAELEDWLDADADDDDDIDLMPPSRNRAALDREELEELEQMILASLTMLARNCMRSRGQRVSRSEVRDVLLDFFVGAPSEIIKVARIGHPVNLVDKVLDSVFPSAAQRPPEQSPAKRRGRDNPQQLTLDFDEP
ncbi:MAG: hypothetical protein HQL87_03615 [Magnetococcales bacterium]|nr:hypothetical protein [Magnetococcales bacterium]